MHMRLRSSSSGRPWTIPTMPCLPATQYSTFEVYGCCGFWAYCSGFLPFCSLFLYFFGG
ncbi:hypothetical protein L873DRAFT_596213 [Choiromyces venosus 120613-1]|uniref:Uncharacterized protein n=1 Tax=Choiromyces venosus 120613-1 TaxID=1336337 RepID=A0A3N4JXH5_9PEZI|nr:hypothetical protein L873DRAFT_596213 [Choiromyces venosus 120613-1]